MLIPNAVLALIQPLNFVILVNDEWIKGGQNIPPSYINPFITTVSETNLQSYRTLIRSNNGTAKLHMDKFGVKYTPFKSNMVTEFKTLRLWDVDALAYLNHSRLNVSTASAYYPTGINYSADADTAKTIKFFFKDNPNESVLHYILPMLNCPYNGTHNQYGGLLASSELTTTAGDIAMVAKYTEETEFLASAITSKTNLVSKFLAAYDQTDVLNISLTGTDHGGLNTDQTIWSLGWMYGLKYGTGLSGGQLENVLLQYIISKMF
jgi:hypothetical protein